MDTPSPQVKEEMKAIGRLQYHRLRRMAAMLYYYRIDTATIEDRLLERGCSRELADWIIQTATTDNDLSKRIEDADTPEPTLQVILKGVNGLMLILIVGLITHFIQLTENLALLVVFGPVLLVASFVGFFMIVRSLVELKRRNSEPDNQ